MGTFRPPPVPSLTQLDGGKSEVAASDMRAGDVVVWEGEDRLLQHVERLGDRRVRAYFEDGDFEDWGPDMELTVLAHIDVPIRLEMGGCYEHVSGEIMRICGSAYTKRHGPCLVSERPGETELVVVSTDADAAKGWRVISQGDFLSQWEADVRAFGQEG